MEIVKLKNGTTEAKPLVNATMLILRDLVDNDPITLYELTMLCRDSSHQLWGSAGTKLKERNLVESDGRVHQSIRNVVLSAVTGDGLDMCLSSPLAEDAAQ